MSGPLEPVPLTPTSFRHVVFQDWEANRGRRKSQVVLALFRLAAACAQGGGPLPALVGRLYIGFYKILTNWFMGVELPPEASVGAPLRLFHPHAIVVHPDVRMGDRCTLRQCTTLGNVDRVGGPPGGAPVVGDDVEFGAGALVIGERRIGDGAVVGAGAVVVDDVDPGAVVVGNPARPIRRPPTQE